MGRAIALASSCSGTGRTTTAINLSVLFAQAGRRTLLVDLGVGWPAVRRLAPEARPDRIVGTEIAAGDRPRLSLLPLSAPRTGEEAARAAAAVQCSKDAWDLVVLDLPPLDGPSSLLLRAADRAVIVASCRGDALKDVAQCIGTLAIVVASHTELQINGILITMGDKRLQRVEKQMARAARSFPVDVLPFCIPWDGALANQGCGFEKAPAGRGTRGYVELAMELLRHG